MRKKRLLLLSAPLVVLGVCLWAAPTQKTVTLAWYPAANWDDISNYTIFIHSSTVATNPLPWPVIGAVVGLTSATVIATNSIQFYYVTAQDNRSNPTNFIAESDPSGVCSFRLLSSGTLTVGKGPN